MFCSADGIKERGSSIPEKSHFSRNLFHHTQDYETDYESALPHDMLLRVQIPAVLQSNQFRVTESTLDQQRVSEEFTGHEKFFGSTSVSGMQ
jgi:hypothetical protein